MSSCGEAANRWKNQRVSCRGNFQYAGKCRAVAFRKYDGRPALPPVCHPRERGIKMRAKSYHGAHARVIRACIAACNIAQASYGPYRMICQARPSDVEPLLCIAFSALSALIVIVKIVLKPTSHIVTPQLINVFGARRSVCLRIARAQIAFAAYAQNQKMFKGAIAYRHASIFPEDGEA